MRATSINRNGTVIPKPAVGAWLRVLLCLAGPVLVTAVSVSASAPELVLQQGHSSSVGCAAFSPDSRLLATGGRDGTVRLWSVPSGELVRILTGHYLEVISVAFSHDGKLVTGAGNGPEIFVWDIQSGKRQRELSNDWRVVDIKFSPDDTIMVVGCYDGKAKLFDLKSGTVLKTLSGHDNDVYTVCYSPDGHFLATAGQDGRIKVWDVATGTLLKTLTGHNGWINSVVFSPDGKGLVSASDDGTVRKWDLASAQLVTTWSDLGKVYNASFSPDGHSIAVSNENGEVNVLDFGQGNILRKFLKEEQVPWTTVISPDWKWLGRATGDGTVEIRRMDDGTLLHTTPYSFRAYSLAFSSSGATLVAGQAREEQGKARGTLAVWNLKTLALDRVIKAHNDAIYSIASSRSGNLFSGSNNGECKLWDMATWKEKIILGADAGGVESVALSSNGKLAAAGYALSQSHSGEVAVWDVGSGKLIRSLKMSGLGSQFRNDREVISVAFADHGSAVVVLCQNGSITLWDIATGGLRLTLKKRWADASLSDTFRAIAVSPDSSKIAAVDELGAGGLWDAGSGEYVQPLNPAEPYGMSGDKIGWVRSVSFSPEGDMVAAGGYSGHVSIWEVATGKVIQSLRTQHTGWLRAVAFSPNGRLLATTGWDGAIKLWSVKKGKLLATLLLLPNGEANSPGDPQWIAFTPEGYYASSTKATSRIRWRVNNRLYPAGTFAHLYDRPSLVRRAIAEAR